MYFRKFSRFIRKYRLSTNLYLIVDEQQLIKRCLGNDSIAQRKLYERYASKLMGICYRYTSSAAEANDVLQEAFIKIFEKLETLHELSALEAWMRKVTVTTALNYLKKHRKHQFTEQIDDYHHLGENEAAHANLGTEELMKLIQELPLNYRTIFNLYALDGFTHRDIGNQLGITESTSRAHYSRARAALVRKIQIINQSDAEYLQRWG